MKTKNQVNIFIKSITKPPTFILFREADSVFVMVVFTKKKTNMKEEEPSTEIPLQIEKKLNLKFVFLVCL